MVPKVSDMQAEVTTTQVTTRGTMRTTMAKKSSTYSHHLVVREMVASYLDVCPAASTLQIMSSGKKRSDVQVAAHHSSSQSNEECCDQIEISRHLPQFPKSKVQRTCTRAQRTIVHRRISTKYLSHTPVTRAHCLSVSECPQVSRLRLRLVRTPHFSHVASGHGVCVPVVSRL